MKASPGVTHFGDARVDHSAERQITACLWLGDFTRLREGSTWVLVAVVLGSETRQEGEDIQEGASAKGALGHVRQAYREAGGIRSRLPSNRQCYRVLSSSVFAEKDERREHKCRSIQTA